MLLSTFDSMFSLSGFLRYIFVAALATLGPASYIFCSRAVGGYKPKLQRGHGALPEKVLYLDLVAPPLPIRSNSSENINAALQSHPAVVELQDSMRLNGCRLCLLSGAARDIPPTANVLEGFRCCFR